MAEAVAEEYRSSLCDLNFNSKPHINMLTMLAEENSKYASVIVKTIVSHVKTVPPELKLPSLYLIDSIMKNIGGQYITLFCDHMITLFSSVFEKVEETTRSALYKLRQTWNDILPKKILYGIDCNVNHIDPAWPITAKVTTAKSPIHVNPKFLGGSSNQAPNAPQDPGKPAVAKKNEMGAKEKEVMEMKKKQDEMLRLIEEKKEQLKALEQKKMEMAAKQKKKILGLVPPALPPQQPVQKKPVNFRDPRLKKSLPAGPTLNDKTNPVVLQSVVVVPNVKPPQDISNNAVDGTLKSVHKVNHKGTKTNVGNKAFHSNEASDSLNKKDDNFPKKAFRATDESKLYEKPTKELHNDKPVAATREHLTRTSKIPNKKHSLNPENNRVEHHPAKRFCKSSVNKSKRLLPHDNMLPEGYPLKKEKQDITKVRKELGAIVDEGTGKMYRAEQRLPEEPILFGTEDKDYRQPARPGTTQAQQWHQPELPPHSNTRISPDTFYPMEHKVTELPLSESNGKVYRDASATHNPTIRRLPDENFQTTKMPGYEQVLIKKENFGHPDYVQIKKINERGSSPLLIKAENPDPGYKMNTLTAERISPPAMKRFMLDGKNRNVYYVNERAFFVTDDNEPREVTFYGPPRNVHIEGVTQPIVLSFDGRTHEFETNGKRNTIRFGTPSREIYINNFPYEAQFGGPPFTALLEDQKEHRILIDGPRPQVLCIKPSNEVYDLLHREVKTSQQAQQDPNLVAKSLENATLIHDVDMRVKSSHGLKSSMIPESRKDVDWRVVPVADKPPWDVSKSSFDSDPTGKNFPDAQSSSLVSKAPVQWDGNKSLVGIHGEHGVPVPERSGDISGGPWPRPAFRPPMEASFEPPMPRPQLVPPKSWDVAPPPVLPPPPSLPPALSLKPPPSLPAISTMPNVSLPPPMWNPLPPPPMFPGQVPEKLPTTLTSSGLVSAAPSIMTTQEVVSEPSVPVPTLPINVETIYEKLVAAGIIAKKPADDSPVVSVENAKNDEAQSEDKMESESKEEPDPEIFLNPKSLKTYYPHVIFALYKGSQCATCGMRFKEIQSEQYSRHLDWHFRMNRREKDGAKKAYSRRLFYEIKDWIQFKEIEEAEERTPSYFELQADGDSSKNEEKEKIQSVPASECETEKCSVCGEQFQLFWVEEEEEWHLRHAVRHDGEAYHPMCYEDFVKATELAKKEAEEKAKREAEEKLRAEEERLRAEEEKLKEAEARLLESLNKETAEEKATSIKTDPDAGTDDKTKIIEEANEKPGGAAADPDAVEVKVEGIKEEKMETESTEEIKTSEDNTCVKEKSEKISENEATICDSEKESEDTSAVSEPSETTPMEVEEPVKKTTENKIDGLSSDVDSDNFEDDFRPPTPDPRFQVLPPVLKGNELSALCSIM